VPALLDKLHKKDYASCTRKEQRMSRTLSIAEAREQLARLADEFEAEQGQPAKIEPVTVTRYGKPVLTILPHEFYEALIETLEILSDPEQMAALREGIQEADGGKGESLDNVLKELGW
jgi:antitoxin YefM